MRIHPTAIVEADVTLGEGTSVWDAAHLRRGATVGAQCIVGGKSYLAPGVKVGNRCKINAFVYICSAVTLEDGVMVSAGTVFTNDRFPRATTPDLQALLSSDLPDGNPETLVREGATLGANCTVGTGITIGRWAMVGMGAVVTKDVPDFALVIGNPARVYGAVCRCGTLLAKMPLPTAMRCDCGRSYSHHDGVTTEAAT